MRTSRSCSPGWDSRDPTLDPSRTLERAPSELTGTNIAITLAGVQSLRHCRATLRGATPEVGADAVMFAIGYPFEFSDAATANVARAELSNEEREKVSHPSAERLSGL